MHAGTDTGLRVKAVMDRGELVGDDVMIGIVRERLDRPDARKGFVLEGFPRTVAQATALDGIMAGRAPLIIVDIVVPESELVRRLSFRLICADCGATATPGTGGGAGQVHEMRRPARFSAPTTPTPSCCERLGVYRRDTKPLVEYYRARPTFCSIDGAQAPDRVTADIASAVEAAVSRGARAAEGQTR